MPEHPSRGSVPGEVATAAARDLFVAASLALLVAAVFAPALSFEFLPWDDDTYLLRNPVIRGGLGFEAIAWSFGFQPGYQYYPLTWLSHALDFSLFGDDPRGHHAVSIGLHALAAGLLYLFLSSTTGARWASALAASIFGVHPLRIESVAWVAERKDVLSVCLAMGCLLAHARWVRRPGPVRRATVLLLLVAGLLSKPMLVSMPVLLLLVDVWPLRRVSAGRARPLGALDLAVEKLPYAVLAAAAAVVAVMGQKAGEGLAPMGASPVGQRLAVALYAQGWYLWKTIAPSDLSVFYPLAAVGPAGIAGGLAATSILLVLAASRRVPLPVRTGVLWYLVALAPVSGLVRVGDQLVADRYSYLPSIGLTVAAVFGVRELVGASRPALRPAAALAGVLLATSYAATTVVDAGRFRNGLTLFSSALERDPGNWLAQMKVGDEMAKASRWEDARSHYAAAFRLRPEWDGAAGNLAQAHARLGETREMSVVLEAGLARNPSSEWLHRLAAALYGRVGEKARADALTSRADELRKAEKRPRGVSRSLNLEPFGRP